VLFSRALVETRLATRAQLEGAARDYEKIIARSDGQLDDSVVSNLAETYMMLDRLDDAVDKYVQASNTGGTDALFGLAVALDRNGQTDRARRVLESLQTQTIQAFHARVRSGATFFVPKGEEYYYEALIEESRHNDQIALEDWRAYVKTNAHPEFQPNAQTHITAILKRLAAHPTMPVHDIDDEF
jgi:tetratricopeptide (TPR) repeat protein